MKRLGRRRWLILIAFLLAASFAGLFAVRTARHALYWSRHRDEAIRPWMSVTYVARSYRVRAPAAQGVQAMTGMAVIKLRVKARVFALLTPAQKALVAQQLRLNRERGEGVSLY